MIAPCGLGWAGLIKNICRSTLLSAFASLIDWEVGAGPWRVTPSLGTGDTQGWVCRDTGMSLQQGTIPAAPRSLCHRGKEQEDALVEKGKGRS